MSNELKLSLDNFQSISHGELIFHTGTNVIIGQSNSGKTATFRALKACLSNPKGSQRFIKRGTGQSTVTLEYEGNQITWKRTEKESSYTINGEDYVHVGNSDSFKIMETNGFVQDSSGTIMNIEEELQTPFPFGISNADLFKLYENVFCVSDSSIILKSAREYEDKVRSEISSLEFDLEKSKNKLNEIRQFKEECDLDRLKRERDLLKEQNSRVLFLKDGLDIIKKALSIQDISVENLLNYNFKDLTQELNELKVLKNSVLKMKKLHLLSKTVPLQIQFEDKSNDYQVKLSYKKELEKLKELNRLNELPSIDIINKIKNYSDLRALKKEIKILKSLSSLEKIQMLDIDSKLGTYNSLIKYSEDLNSIKNTIKLKTERVTEIEKSIGEFEQKLKKFDVCPLCHRPF